MIPNVKKLQEELDYAKKQLAYKYFTKMSVFNLQEFDSESISNEYYPFEIDAENNLVTELPRDLVVDALEIDTDRNLFVVKTYSDLW